MLNVGRYNVTIKKNKLINNNKKKLDDEYYSIFLGVKFFTINGIIKYCL